MRTANFAADVLYPIAHLLGIDPEQDLLKDHARAWASSVNSWVRAGWTYWPWPELEITEERAFRQIWHTDVTYTSNQGENSEFYYIPTLKYYRTIGAPPAGTIPVSVGLVDPYFAIIADADLDRHIAFEQWGKQSIEMIVAVNATNTRVGPTALGLDFDLSGAGIDLPFSSGPTVWITFTPRPPLFTTSTRDTARTYGRGELVFDIDSGDCFIALASGQNKGVNLAAYWLRQDFPYFLTEYVVAMAAADQTDDIQTKAELRAMGEEAIQAEVSKLLRQGQRTKYRRFGLGTAWRNYMPRVALVTNP